MHLIAASDNLAWHPCPTWLFCESNHAIETGREKAADFFGSSSFCEAMQVRLRGTPTENVLNDGLDAISIRGSTLKKRKIYVNINNCFWQINQFEEHEKKKMDRG